MTDEISQPTVDYRASFLAADAEIKRLEAALRVTERWHNQLVLQRDKALELLDWAWTIIANAGEGDWTKESSDWQEAAGKWRDVFHAISPPAADQTTRSTR